MPINIIDLYEIYTTEEEGSELQFKTLTGISKSEFDDYSKLYYIKNPGNMNSKIKLVAYYYFKKQNTAAADVGESLGYSQSNSSRDGKKFLNQELKLIKTNGASRKVKKITDNNTASLACFKENEIWNEVDKEWGVTEQERDPLDPKRIAEHAARRVDLFFYLLIAYYKTGLKVDIADTVNQYGQGNREQKTNACHSSILPALSDSKMRGAGILNGTHFSEELNSTVELHESVNDFDSNCIEGKATSKTLLRPKALAILNEVALGEKSPEAGLLCFLIDLHQRFDDIKQDNTYFTRVDRTKSAQTSRKLIYDAQKLGSFQGAFFKADKNNLQPLLNPAYLALLLKLSDEDKKKLEEAKGADGIKEAIYANAFDKIKAEMGLPQVGLFSKKVEKRDVVVQRGHTLT